MQARTKHCKSQDAINEVVQEEVAKFIQRRKREEKKQDVEIVRIEKELETAVELAKEAEEKAEELLQQKETLAKEVKAIDEDTELKDFAGTRAQKERRKQEALKAKQDEEAAIATQLAIAVEESKAKQRVKLAAEKKKAEVVVVEEEDNMESAKKKSRTCMYGLDNLATPRTLAVDHPECKPPTRVGRSVIYEAPGHSWKSKATKTLMMFELLRTALVEQGLVSQALTFSTLVQFIAPNDDDMDFNGKVFTYLLAVILIRTRYVPYQPFQNLLLATKSFVLTIPPFL